MLLSRDSWPGNFTCFRHETRYKGKGLKEKGALQQRGLRHSLAMASLGSSLPLPCTEPPTLPPASALLFGSVSALLCPGGVPAEPQPMVPQSRRGGKLLRGV